MRLSEIAGIRFSFDRPDQPEPDGLVRCRQVHGKEVLLVTGENADSMGPSEADGLITTGARPVGIQTADCLPVLFSSNDGRVVAAVHAGWRGMHLGILPATVQRFAELGVGAERLVVAIGPGIGRCCFEVSPEVVAQFENTWGSLWEEHGQSALDKGRANRPWHEARPAPIHAARSQAVARGGSHWIDLDRIARLQLENTGVAGANIEDVGHCTYCGPGELASFRRGTHEGIKAGRQWAWIVAIR